MRSSWRMVTSGGGSHGDPEPEHGDSSGGAGPPGPALAGCLGKAEDRGEVTGYCPWCSAKGQTSALRSYAINFKESITLCSSPPCLFPLISRPLEDVSSSLLSARDVNACKRKSRRLESEEPNLPPKRQKKEQSDDVLETSDRRVSTESLEEEPFPGAYEETKGVCNDVEKTSTETPAACDEGPVLCEASQTEVYVSGVHDEAGEAPLVDLATQGLIEMIAAPLHLFWRNKDNLCWLDSLLVALVHLRTFSEGSCERVSWTDSSKNCAVRNVCARYRKTCAYLKTKEQRGQGNVQISSDVLQKAERELDALQLSVFQLLQPKLPRELGQKETPVFALPLLLKTDEWAHGLFQHTAQWEFKCTSCRSAINTSVEKTLTTFTQLTADWHPLRAVHRAQCSNCRHKNQKRKLVFQRLSPVLALHFAEGLPRRDVSRYSFDFQGAHYAIRTIIQYNEQLEHFITWVHQPDGSWLEFDDLKYPNCVTHKRFTLRSSQFHIVFWEAKSRKASHLPEPVREEDSPVVEVSSESVCFPDVSNSAANDTGIIESLTLNDTKNEAVGALDSSIGSTTLLETFEGLSHSDIITLTFEVKDNEEEPPPNPPETVTQLKSGVSESSAELVKTAVSQAPRLLKHKISAAKDTSSTPLAPEIILPPAVKTSAAEVRPQVAQRPLLLSKPSLSNMSLLQMHPSFQSTPQRVPLPASQLKPEGNEALPGKPAELFGGFRAKNSSHVLPGGFLKPPLMKVPCSPAPVSLPQKALGRSGGAAPFQPSEILKAAGRKPLDQSANNFALSTTDALRLKLMKKLKAKKKKLAKLNQLLGKQSIPRPDSTDLTSPYSVTSSSSVYDSPAYDHFFAELLSPATTCSSLSPDSTGLLEMLTHSQGGETPDNTPQENPAADKADFPASVHSEPSVNDPSSTNDAFFDEFISGSGGHQSVIEHTDFNSLDMFF